MELTKGSIFTPDKKRYLTDEIEKEISLLDKEVRGGILGSSYVNTLKDIRTNLKKKLDSLYNKQGVVTPQETDEILDLLGNSKRSRLEKDFYFGMKKSTIYLLAFVAVGFGLYFYTKKEDNEHQFKKSIIDFWGWNHPFLGF